MEEKLSLGEKAPIFCLPNQEGKEICLKDYLGKWVILYFYPKDHTSGCTLEAMDFTSKLSEFSKRNAVVIGVSPDSVRSHWNFMQKHDLKVTLLSDPDKEVLNLYGALGIKKRYGREFLGVIRSTFLIDPEGIIKHIWRKVKVKGHVEEVLNKLIELQSN